VAAAIAVWSAPIAEALSPSPRAAAEARSAACAWRRGPPRALHRAPRLAPQRLPCTLLVLLPPALDQLIASRVDLHQQLRHGTEGARVAGLERSGKVRRNRRINQPHE
jgi:hypothetical protein